MNDDKAYGVLIDTVSIQPYIFGSNKLKENLGASYVVQDIYDSLLLQALSEIFPNVRFDDMKKWWRNPDEVFKQHPLFDVGYIGGGNALLLFEQSDQAEQFLKAWTTLLLIHAPGITTAVACGEIALKPPHFEEAKKTLFNQLNSNKLTYSPQTILPRHGITAECSHSGFSKDVWHNQNENSEYISSVSHAKISDEVIKNAKSKIKAIFQDTSMFDYYDFTDELDELGQEKGKDSHIAIVHIDGNEMGKRFQATTSLEEIRRLAHNVEGATKNAFEKLVMTIVKEFPQIEQELNYHNHNHIIPLRSIILGGDDITFVSEGRLGIYCAELFMNAFEAQKSVDGKPLNLTACAGIAITKTKFPFYRGYELAEQLCKAAKQRRHEEKLKDNKKSWLDFHLAHGGFSGSLKEIRERHYMTARGTLLLRPYLLNSSEEFGFDALIDHARQLKYLPDSRPNFPHSKIQELRTVLTQSEDAARRFVAEQQQRGRTLPFEKYRDELFVGDKTPYFDMIEFLEYYPDFALRASKEGRK